MNCTRHIFVPKFLTVFILFSLFNASLLFGGVSCQEHIKNFVSPNFEYPQNPASRAITLGQQRECLHSKNPLFSGIYEFNKKMDLLLPVSQDFTVRKNLIHWQESAEGWDAAGDGQKASQYIDKFNALLADNINKHKAAVLLLQQAQRDMIGAQEQEDIFYKTQDYLLNFKKCKPGICDGYATLSFVANQLPVCAQDSCLNYVTYENLYFNLASKLGKEEEAANTVKELLAKDFGTAQSNGEVKGPLVSALALFDGGNFEKETKFILDEAANKNAYDFALASGGYDEQDALLVRPVMEYLAVLGNMETLKEYARGSKGSVSLEATLALALTSLEAGERSGVRKNLEKYYEKTSACANRGLYMSGDIVMSAESSNIYLTRNAELDLQLRQRISQAYWTDGKTLNALRSPQTKNLACAPALGGHKIDSVLFIKNITQAFVRDDIIDTLLFAPVVAGVGAAKIIKAVRSAPKFVGKIKYVDFTKNARRASSLRNAERKTQKAVIIDLRKGLKENKALKIAVGQDFFDDGGRAAKGIGNLKVYNRGLSAAEIEAYSYGADNFEKIGSAGRIYGSKPQASKSKSIGRAAVKNKDISAQKRKALDNIVSAEKMKDAELFTKIIKENPWVANIGKDRLERLARAFRTDIKDAAHRFTEPSLVELLNKKDERVLDVIIAKIEDICRQNPAVAANKRMRVEYLPLYGRRASRYNLNNIKLVVEENMDFNNIRDLVPLSRSQYKRLVGKNGLVSPRNPQDMAAMYIELLGGTPSSPVILDTKAIANGFKLYSADGSKMIRVASHECSAGRAPHFHLYMQGKTKNVFTNYRVPLFQNLNGSTERILLPYDELINDARIVLQAL